MEEQTVSQNAVVKKPGLKLLVTIVNRGRGRDVVDVCRTFCMSYHIALLGTGTATSEILDYLGLGETEKDVILSTVRTENLDELLEALTKRLKLNKAGNGIAFTVPIKSVGGPKTLNILSGIANGAPVCFTKESNIF